MERYTGEMQGRDSNLSWLEGFKITRTYAELLFTYNTIQLQIIF